MSKRHRSYRLTPEGLASLRMSARRRRPWEHSTGPKTEEGKSTVALNALKHGLRSATARQELREINALLDVASGAASVDPSNARLGLWIDRAIVAATPPSLEGAKCSDRASPGPHRAG